MHVNRFVPLPAPHSSVSMRIRNVSPGRWWLIEYRGEASGADLVGAGAAEPAMVLPGRRGVGRSDSNGHRFTRTVSRDGVMIIRRWIEDHAVAAALPGMAAALRSLPAADICAYVAESASDEARWRFAVESLQEIIEECDALLAAGVGYAPAALAARWANVVAVCHDGELSDGFEDAPCTCVTLKALCMSWIATFESGINAV